MTSEDTPLPTREILLSGINRVIFDLDGTLTLDLKNPDSTLFRDSLLYRKIEENAIAYITKLQTCSPEEAATMVLQVKANGGSLRRHVVTTYDIKQEDYFANVWNIDPSEVVILRPFVHEVLDQLKEEERTLILLSKAPSIWQQRVFRHFSINQFDQVFTGEINDDKTIVFDSLAGMYLPSSFLSIGDSPEHDIRPARLRGMRAHHLTKRNDLAVLLK